MLLKMGEVTREERKLQNGLQAAFSTGPQEMIAKGSQGENGSPLMAAMVGAGWSDSRGWNESQTHSRQQEEGSGPAGGTTDWSIGYPEITVCSVCIHLYLVLKERQGHQFCCPTPHPRGLTFHPRVKL